MATRDYNFIVGPETSDLPTASSPSAASDIVTKTYADGLITTHEADTTAHPASSIVNTPSGNLAATTVQAALDELQTDVDGRIAASTATTKGDLLVRDASAVTRLAVGTDGQVLTADSAQTTGTKWATPASAPDQSYEISNLALSCSVSSNALTIALKTKGGSDPSAGDAVKIGFRSSTVTSGVYNQRSVTSALSVVVSSGSTLGHASGTDHYIYVYAIDNAGTVELAVSSVAYDEGTVLSTTAEGGAGAADSNRVVYSTTARSNVPTRLIGRLKSNQTAAGTWAAAPTEVCVWPFLIWPISFSAYQNTLTTVLNDTVTTVVSDVKDWDSHNAYSTSTGQFTSPKSTWYHVSGGFILNTASSAFNGTSEELQIIVTVNGSIKRRFKKIPYSTEAYPGLTIGVDVAAAAGETIEMQVYHNSGAASYGTVASGPYTWFSVHELKGR